MFSLFLNMLGVKRKTQYSNFNSTDTTPLLKETDSHAMVEVVVRSENGRKDKATVLHATQMRLKTPRAADRVDNICIYEKEFGSTETLETASKRDSVTQRNYFYINGNKLRKRRGSLESRI